VRRRSGGPVVVEAHFDEEGGITPRRFAWRGSSFQVEGVGRRWREGDERCFAIMAAGGKTFELRLNDKTLCWRLSRVPGMGWAV